MSFTSIKKDGKRQKTDYVLFKHVIWNISFEP